MLRLLSDKRGYFAFFGALGGLLSALAYDVIGLESAFASWVVGTGFDGACIAALLAVGQARYVGKSVDWRGFPKAMFIGGVGGAVGGFVALEVGFPLVQMLGGATDAGRFIGWMLGGGVIGFAVSRVVPNLNVMTACIAGASGGLAGCGLMYLMFSLAAGTATTGAAVGLAIAYAESAFRRLWLEVTVRPRGLSLDKERTIMVTLGEKPVLFGCAADADVKLAEMAGAKAHFAKITLSAGRVIFLDMVTEKSRNLSVGEGVEVSNAHVVVRAKLDVA